MGIAVVVVAATMTGVATGVTTDTTTGKWWPPPFLTFCRGYRGYHISNLDPDIYIYIFMTK